MAEGLRQQRVWGFATARRRYHIADENMEQRYRNQRALCGRKGTKSDGYPGWLTLGEITCKRCRYMWLRSNRGTGGEA